MICDLCQRYSHSPYLVCAVHPDGPDDAQCPDFALMTTAAPDQEEELWVPNGASYYNGELIITRPAALTTTEQLELLDIHPLFTGKCPRCSWEFLEDNLPVHYDCPQCLWKDDTL